MDYNLPECSLSMGFSRQEYESGLPCQPPRDLPNSGIKPASPALKLDSLLSKTLGNPTTFKVYFKTLNWKLEEEDNRRDGWMALPIQCTWTWANSRRWWGTGMHGMLQSLGLQRVGQDLVGDWTTTTKIKKKKRKKNYEWKAVEQQQQHFYYNSICSVISSNLLSDLSLSILRDASLSASVRTDFTKAQIFLFGFCTGITEQFTDYFQ